MLKSTSWLTALLLTTACTRQLTPPAVAINSASFKFTDRIFQAPAKANIELASPGNDEQLIIKIGSRPITPEVGIFMLAYSKSATSLPEGYRLTSISYSYLRNGDSINTYNVQYNKGLIGKLIQLKGGGYSGTFKGTFDGQGTEMGESSAVEGNFTNVFTTR